MRRSVLAAASLALGLALVSPTLAHAQSLTTVINDTLRGGVTVDGWGVASSETALTRGTFHLRIPEGSQIRRAVLVSATMSSGPTVPAGPEGNPRVVVLGAGETVRTVTIEGTPTDSVRSPTYGFYWGEWTTDVTETVERLYAASRSPAFDVAVAERGDFSSSFPMLPFILGHTLVVEYDNPAAPLRNVVMYAGAANAGFMTSAPLPLPSPVANNCPPSSPRSEPFAASLGIHFEWNVGEEDQPVTVNGMRVASNAGGTDDSDSPSTPEMGIFSGLTTTGSFGGADPTPSSAIGAPQGLEDDELLGPPTRPAGRRDDELYDFRPIVADGATTLTFAYSSAMTADDQMVGSLVLQTLARDSMDDADRDGVSDEIEGNCTVDSDSDGTPDYLDLDSDNDCLGDAMEAGAARTDPLMPGSPDANCAREGLRLTCDGAVGVCVCLRSAQCGGRTPVCDLVRRACVGCATGAECAAISPEAPMCIVTGDLRGSCVTCRTGDDCPAGQVCDASRRCVIPALDGGIPPMDGAVPPDASSDVGATDAPPVDVSDAAPDATAVADATDGGAVDALGAFDVRGDATPMTGAPGGGCGCRAVPAPASPRFVAPALFGLALAALRRKRRA